MKRNSIDVSLSSSRAHHFFLEYDTGMLYFPVEGRACQKSRAPPHIGVECRDSKRSVGF